MCTTLADKITAIAIGRFDGAHKGHYALFEHLGEHGAIVVIDTKKANLTPPEHLQNIVPYPVYRYDIETLRHLSGEEFIAFLTQEFPALQTIIVGYDFYFGKERGWNSEDIHLLFHGETVIVPAVTIEGEAVHSRKIRAFLLKGNFEKVEKFLGRRYSLCGHVIQGQGIGRNHLVATLNINTGNYLLPPEGIYVTRTLIHQEWYKSVTFLGHRLSTDGNFAVETHILEEIPKNCDTLCIEFYKKIRSNSYFETLEALKKQIQSDIDYAIDYLNHKKD